MREVAYNTLVQRRRQELHLDTARAIAALYPADEYVEMIAYHYSRTDVHDEAAEWLERAGDRAAATYANETAIANYKEARRRLELTRVEPTIFARLDEKLGGVLVTVGQNDEALKLLERAVEAYRDARELEAAGRATARLGVAHGRHGTGAEGIVRVQPMIELLSWSGPSPALAALHIALARLFQEKGRYQEMVTAAERASEIARVIGDDRLLGEAEERRGTAFSYLGRPEEARQALEGAIPLLEAAGDLASLYRAIGNLGEAHRLQGDLATARLFQERCLEVCERAGDPSQIAFTLVNLGEILIPLGGWAEAQTYLERAQDVLNSMGSATYVAAYPPAMLGRLFLATGEWEQAAQHLEGALSIARRTEDRQAIEAVEACLGELDVLERRPKAALDRIGPLAAEPDAWLGLLLPVLARAYRALEELDRALEVAQGAVQQIRVQGEGLLLIDALLVQGMVLIDLRRWEEANGSLDEALSLARRISYPLAEARILVELGRMHRERCEAAAAQGACEEALAIFRRLGAKKDVEDAEQMLAELAAV
jgi:tetratricopeptide (TPR) repeat protein